MDPCERRRALLLAMGDTERPYVERLSYYLSHLASVYDTVEGGALGWEVWDCERARVADAATEA